MAATCATGARRARPIGGEGGEEGRLARRWRPGCDGGEAGTAAEAAQRMVLGRNPSWALAAPNSRCADRGTRVSQWSGVRPGALHLESSGDADSYHHPRASGDSCRMGPRLRGDDTDPRPASSNPHICARRLSHRGIDDASYYDPGGKTRATWNAFDVTSHFPSIRWNIR